MKFATFFAAFLAAIPVAFADLSINSPSGVTTCEPTQLQWTQTTGPYYLSILPAGQASANPIKQFPAQTGTSLAWTVDILSGTSITIQIKDGSGNVAYSSIITILSGTSTSCVNSAVQESGSGSSSPASTGSSGSAATTGSATSTASGSSTSSTSTSSKSNGAGRLSAASAFGVAGIMGLVGAALF